MKKLALFLPLAVSLVCSCKSEEDWSDLCETAYSDVISTLVVGFSTHWGEFLPDEVGLSDVYGYESPCLSFAQQDINGDHIPELLIGDDFSEGDYHLYDIYTFDTKSGGIVHLLCGGERDSFVVTGDGVIVEDASNSAFDSKTNYYVIEGTELRQVEGSEEALLMPEFDRVLRYVAPSAYVAVKDGEILGELLRSLDDCYLVCLKDSVRVSKEGVEIQHWSAFDGCGVVYPEESGEYQVYESRSTESPVRGDICCPEGCAPRTLICTGYNPGWFTVDYEGSESFVPEELFTWDFTDRL